MKGNCKACSCIRGAGLLGLGGGEPQTLGFSLRDLCIRICSSAPQGFALSCKSFAKRFLLQPALCPVLLLARFACTHKDTRAIRYLRVRAFPGGFLLPCWPATALSQGSVLLAAVARGYAVGLARLDPKKQASTSLGVGEGELCFNAAGTQQRSQELHFTANFHSGALTSHPCFPLCTLGT